MSRFSLQILARSVYNSHSLISMMYSATLLVSLLASSHGFASTPDDPIKPIYPPAAKHDPYDQLPAVPSFELTSETVTHGATLAAPQRSAAFGVPGGEDVSPHLAWTGAPAGTKSYVVTCYDPDAPTVSGFWHWAMYDIPADVLSLPLNAGDKGGAGMPAGAKMLLNDAGFAGYLGAAPRKPAKPASLRSILAPAGMPAPPLSPALSGSDSTSAGMSYIAQCQKPLTVGASGS